MNYIKLFEEFNNGVDFDVTVMGKLKEKVGELTKLSPFVLKLGGTPPLRVSESLHGRINVIDSTGNIIKIFRSVDTFLDEVKPKTIKV